MSLNYDGVEASSMVAAAQDQVRVVQALAIEVAATASRVNLTGMELEDEQLVAVVMPLAGAASSLASMLLGLRAMAPDSEQVSG